MINRYGKLLFIDLETTGPNPASDLVTEIGIVEVSASGISRWSTLVNPEVSIPPFIRQLTGISDEMVQDAPTFAALADELAGRLREGLFIAHNARFDYGFLRNAFRRLDRTLRCDVLCTVKLSRKLFPQEMRHGLDALIDRHGLTTGDRHRALADADTLWQYWRKLEEMVPQQQLHATVEELLQRPNVPAHLSPEMLDDIPATPGVYLFYGDNDALLYVGKSIHLRARVLSHFASDGSGYKEMRISREVRRLECRETAGEVGALLLEAQLIKDMQPIHNRMLRRQRELCAWQLRRAPTGCLQPVLTFADEQDFGSADNLYGLFCSRRKAEAALLGLAQRHELCLATLGLESRAKTDKPCFAHQLRRCRGACIGKEPLASHEERLLDALSGLKVSTWPYPGAVGLVEAGANGRRDIHVVNNWCFLGTARSDAGLRQLLAGAPPRPAFDVDTYRILLRAFARDDIEVRPLVESEADSACPPAFAC